MKKRFVQLLTGALCLSLIFGSAWALDMKAVAESDVATSEQTQDVYEDPEVIAGEADAVETDVARYVATATAALKVRRSPDRSALGNGSISKGDIVYIIELGDEWSKVDLGRNIGYVQTKYLSDIREYSESQGTTGDEVQTPAATTQPDTSGDTPAGFKENFVAYACKAIVARSQMDERSSAAFRVPKYKEVTVSSNQGDWSYIRYNNSYGYVPTSSLFKWDRIDPYAGDIPGCDVHTALVFLNHTTDIRSYDEKGNEVLKTVNPGTAIAVDALDGLSRYPLPYWRTTGYVDQSDVGYKIDVVPWEDAQSGDLISCMSTFYAVGIHTVNYQGRNYNIYLATSFVSGLVVHPNEKVDIYDVMGPYRSSTGYHRAPIMSQHALWGYGGGTCQVNTTLYNALIQLPIYINWRKVHADVGIYYCPVGFDAAVGGGDITMIFTNTLPYAIRFNFFMSDGCLTVGIFKV